MFSKYNNNNIYFITASQTFKHSEQSGTNQPLTLQCETNDFALSVYFKLNSTNKGGCLASGICNSGINGYQDPIRTGTTITEMVITLCNEARDFGNWTCTYGGSTSTAVAITTCKSFHFYGGFQKLIGHSSILFRLVHLNI